MRQHDLARAVVGQAARGATRSVSPVRSSASARSTLRIRHFRQPLGHLGPGLEDQVVAVADAHKPLDVECDRAARGEQGQHCEIDLAGNDGDDGIYVCGHIRQIGKPKRPGESERLQTRRSISAES